MYQKATWSYHTLLNQSYMTAFTNYFLKNTDNYTSASDQSLHNISNLALTVSDPA